MNYFILFYSAVKSAKLSGMIVLAMLPMVANAQLYQDASNSTAAIVRDPARQTSTEIDAVISNPAGTAFMNDGLHFSLSGKESKRSIELNYEGNEATNTARDILPSLQAVFKKGRWSFSASFANEGGYGFWCSSESPLANFSINNHNDFWWTHEKKMNEKWGNNAYGIDETDKLMSRMKVSGDLYNYTIRLGVAKQFGKLSAYLGIRTNYVTEKTELDVYRWVEEGGYQISPYKYFSFGQEWYNNDIERYKNHPNHYETDYPRMNGWGFSPVVGLDFKTGKFNFALKYEFEAKIHTNDGFSSFHIPAVLSGGASWQILNNLKFAVGGTFTHQKARDANGKDYLYGMSQTSKSDPNFSFFPEHSPLLPKWGADNVDRTSTSFNVSASISFSPFNRFLISLGYTYASRGPLYKSIYPLSLAIPANRKFDMLSGGFCYQFSDNVKFDFGVSKVLPASDSQFYTLNVQTFDNIQTLNVSAGISVNLK